MSDRANPHGLDGFAFCEFTSPDPTAMAAQFEQLGFVAAARVPERDLLLYRQGRTVFILNAGAGQAAAFRALHGPSANGMAFRVDNAGRAFELALSRGAMAADSSVSALPGAYAVEGIGGSLLYLVDRDPFVDWEDVPGWRETAALNNVGLDLLDHLTHNVRRGQMRVWADFYARVFGFEEQKYFDIKGKATGLFSQAMIAPDRAIRIPLNESQDDKSQIEEFIRDYNGEGILLQIFTENMVGPIFFEIIQRKGNEGFGNGNFQALYESIELDQIRRGVVTIDA